jgi:hypothetical protein
MNTTASRSTPVESVDESWPMVEEAVFRLFEQLAAEGGQVAIGPRLEELGWADIEAEYPIAAGALLFEAEGRSLATTDCLDRVMVAELRALIDGPIDGIVIPEPSDGFVPASDRGRVTGLVLGPLRGRVIVPVAGALGGMSIGVVEASHLEGGRIDTFDPSVEWTRVEGAVNVELVDASIEWDRAVAAAHRALGTELIALAGRALDIAIEQVSARTQFGVSIGSLQSPRHALAEAAAAVAGARALLDESWRYGGRLSALAAKAAAGRAHRTVADVTLQVCGAIGLTAEHALHRYVSRGFQLDALCGSAEQLEAWLAEYLFEANTAEQALPAIVTWT